LRTIVRCSAKPTIPDSRHTQQHHYKLYYLRFQFSLLLFNVFISQCVVFVKFYQQSSVDNQHRHLLISCNTQQHRFKLFLLQFQYSLLLFKIFISIHIVFVIGFQQSSVVQQNRQFHMLSTHNNITTAFCFINFNCHHYYSTYLCRLVSILLLFSNNYPSSCPNCISCNTPPHHYRLFFLQFQFLLLLFYIFISISVAFIIVFQQSTTVDENTSLLSSSYFVSFQSTTLSSILLISTFKSIQYIMSILKIIFYSLLVFFIGASITFQTLPMLHSSTLSRNFVYTF
jgi:hypothetical protein